MPKNAQMPANNQQRTTKLVIPEAQDINVFKSTINHFLEQGNILEELEISGPSSLTKSFNLAIYKLLEIPSLKSLSFDISIPPSQKPDETLKHFNQLTNILHLLANNLRELNIVTHDIIPTKNLIGILEGNTYLKKLHLQNDITHIWNEQLFQGDRFLLRWTELPQKLKYIEREQMNPFIHFIEQNNLDLIDIRILYKNIPQDVITEVDLTETLVRNRIATLLKLKKYIDPVDNPNNNTQTQEETGIVKQIVNFFPMLYYCPLFIKHLQYVDKDFKKILLESSPAIFGILKDLDNFLPILPKDVKLLILDYVFNDFIERNINRMQASKETSDEIDYYNSDEFLKNITQYKQLEVKKPSIEAELDHYYAQYREQQTKQEIEQYLYHPEPMDFNTIPPLELLSPYEPSAKRFKSETTPEESLDEYLASDTSDTTELFPLNMLNSLGDITHLD